MDTNSKFQSLLPFLKQYRLLLLPLIPLVLLFLFIIFLFIQALQPTPNTKTTKQNQVTQPIPTSTISIPPLTPLPSGAWGAREIEMEDNPETFPGFEKKEKMKDGTTIYYYTSQKPDRPNITIRNVTNELVFYREQGTNELPLMKIPLIKETYGEPDKIIQGSTYYGPQAVIYFYKSISRAYVINPETSETYEVQSFPPMSAEEYLQRYKALN